MPEHRRRDAASLQSTEATTTEVQVSRRILAGEVIREWRCRGPDRPARKHRDRSVAGRGARWSPRWLVPGDAEDRISAEGSAEDSLDEPGRQRLEFFNLVDSHPFRT